MNRKNIAGMTLVETLVALGLGSLVLLVLGSVSLYGARSFSSMQEYRDLNKTNRFALDKISREIRQSRGLSSFSTSTNKSTLVFKVNPAGTDTFSLIYDKPARTVKELSAGKEKVLLTECTYFNAQLFQQSPIANSFDFVPTDDPAKVKMVQLDWSCQRRVTHSITNSESVQSMKIVVRKRPT